MAKINVLESSVYNIIAAGEVVERPRSIVKELVENSIDAGATHVTINILNGGKSYIEITDNGSGIDSEYVTTAFLPHSTSKVSNANDLAAISTLGFRGEALASIASVSRVELTTQSAYEDCGIKVVLLAGNVEERTTTNRAHGVTISIKDLFFNTPARLKFLRSDRSEQQEITQAVTNLILANPHVSIEYYANGEMINSSSGRGLGDAVYSIYGKAVCDKLIPVNKTIDNYIITGYISHPELTKSNRSYQTTIINGRIVTNATISSAVSRAYDTGVMRRAFPVFVLDVIMPFDEVDVNVHPNKADVRFVDNNKVFKHIYAAVKEALISQVKVFSIASVLKNDLNENTSVKNASNSASSQDKLQDSLNAIDENTIDKTSNYNNQVAVENKKIISFNAVDNSNVALDNILDIGNLITEVADKNSNIKDIIEGKLAQFKDITISSDVQLVAEQSAILNDVLADSVSGSIGYSGNIPDEKEVIYENYHNRNSAQKDSSSATNVGSIAMGSTSNAAVYTETEHIKNERQIGSTQSIQDNFFTETGIDSVDQKLTIIAQIFDAYLLVKKGKVIYLIDQHAAHERLIYDQLIADIDNREIVSQPLLIPQIIVLSALDYDYIISIKDDLASIGLDIGEFGNNTIKVSACPATIANFRLANFVDGLLAKKHKFTAIKLKDALKNKLIIEACKAAVKAGDKLNEYQINGLIDLMRDNLPLQCPHGRPAIIRIERSDIDKIFKRIL